MPLSDSDVKQFWAIAESLVSANAITAAIAVLDGLLALAIPPSMIAEEVATRVRAADLALTDTALHPDIARRFIEPAVKIFHHFSVSPELRANCLKILSVVARRRSQYAQAVAYLQQCAAVVKNEFRHQEPSAADTPRSSDATPVKDEDGPKPLLPQRSSGPAGTSADPPVGSDASLDASSAKKRRIEGNPPAAFAAAGHASLATAVTAAAAGFLLRRDTLLCHIALELSRTHYGKVLESNFADLDAIVQMAAATQRYAHYAQNMTLLAVSATLCVSHVFALLLQGQLAPAVFHLKEAERMFGACPEFAALLLLVEMQLLGNAVASPAGGGGGAGRSSAGSFRAFQWLSDGSLRVLTLFLDLMRRTNGAASSSSSASLSASSCGAAHHPHGSSDVATHLKELTAAVEEQMRALTALKRQSSSVATAIASVPSASSTSSPAAVNSEIRFLVGVKVAGYIEVILADLTRLDIVAALQKLEPLCSYLLLFRQHTVHYRAHLHLVIAATAMCLIRCSARGEQAVEVAQRHLQCAEDSAAESGTVLTARLFRALFLQTLLKESNATASKRAASGEMRRSLDLLVEGLQAGFDQSAASAPASAAANAAAAAVPGSPPPPVGGWTLRHRALFSLVVGGVALACHDYPKAVQQLKLATECNKQQFGLQNASVCQSLRLLSHAHAMAGAEEQGEIALTTASQLASKVGDEHTTLQCLHWTLSHIICITESDKRLQTQLQAALGTAQARLQAQYDQVGSGLDWAKVSTFLPDRADYASWLAKLQHPHSK